MKNLPLISSQNSCTLPHLQELLPHQKEILRDKHRFKVVVAHRRSRKTTTGLEKMCLEAFNPRYKNRVYWIIYPTFAEAKSSVWTDPNMIRRVIPNELIEKTNESELTVYFKSGSLLSLKSADRPERLLGSGPTGVILDETAEMNPSVWERIIEPIMRSHDGWCWFIGTPKGRNWFYNLYLKGLSGQKEWKSWLLPASQTNVLDPEQLELAKADMPDALYRQEFECEFLEGEATVFRHVKAIATATKEEPQQGHSYVMGVDLAKVQDYTVCAMFDRNTNSQVFQDRFNKLDWVFQVKRIKENSKRYNNASVIIDSTGLGDPVVDSLLREGVSVAPYTFEEGYNKFVIKPYHLTETFKKELIEKLSIWIDQRKLRILPIEESINELESFSYELGPTGHIRYGAPSGLHDDIVIALALACWELYPIVREVPKQTSAIRETYNRLARKWIDTDDEEGDIERDYM